MKRQPHLTLFAAGLLLASAGGALAATHYADQNSASATPPYTCTTPQADGIGNITNAPLFVDTNGWANLRLQSNSPCINAGNNAYVVGSTDLDGNPRSGQ